MGNCMTIHHKSNKIASLSPQDDDDELTKIDKKMATTTTTTRSISTSKKAMKQKKHRKSVRFDDRGGDDKGEEEDGRNLKSTTRGAVRIRVLVTKKELREILRQHREELRSSSSLEELVRAVRLRECRGRFSSKDGRVCDGEWEERVVDGVWRPTLATIVEEL